MRPTQLAMLLAAVALIGMGATSSIFYSLYFYDVQTVPVIIDVEKGVAGIVTDTDALRMGTISPGQYSIRRLELTPDRSCTVVTSFTGTAGAFMRAEPASVEAEQGETVTIEFTAYIPPRTPEGHYEGEAVLRFYRRWF